VVACDIIFQYPDTTTGPSQRANGQVLLAIPHNSTFDCFHQVSMAVAAATERLLRPYFQVAICCLILTFLRKGSHRHCTNHIVTVHLVCQFRFLVPLLTPSQSGIFPCVSSFRIEGDGDSEPLRSRRVVFNCEARNVNATTKAPCHHLLLRLCSCHIS
jgi:hypothetical protein